VAAASWVAASTSFSFEHGGVTVVVHAGELRRASDPIVRARPEMWRLAASAVETRG
jgi:hypothetical protein